MIKNFQDLEVWQKADALAHRVFDLTESFPSQYRFDLTGQLRRAALSVPTNLAEGCATTHTKELLQFINIAHRSSSETQYLLLFSCRRQLTTAQTYQQFTRDYDEVRRMLHGLANSLQHAKAVNAHRRISRALLGLVVFYVTFTSHWPLATNHYPVVLAQSTNGTTTLVQETVVAGGGRIGGGNPMSALTIAGEPSGGTLTNSAYTLYVGYRGASATLPPGMRMIAVEGTTDEPACPIDVNGIRAPTTGTNFKAEGIQLVEGPNTITVTSTDAAGNRAATTITVSLDTRPPARPTHAATPSVVSGSAYTLTGTKTAGTSIWINGTQVVALNSDPTWSITVTLAEGDNDFVIVAKDAVGNVSTSAVATTVVDNLPPVITAAPPAKTNLTPYALTGTVDDHLTTVEVNGRAATRSGRSFEADLTLIEGTNTITITATSPNKYVSTKTLTIILGTIPTIASSAPADGAKLYLGTSTTLQATATVKEADPIQYQLLLNGAVLSDWGTSNNVAWTPTAAQAGVHTVELRARDAFGGFASRTARILVLRKPVEHQ